MAEGSPGAWYNINSLPPKLFVCGYCNNTVASDRGYYSDAGRLGFQTFIYICPFCNRPTYLFGDNQTPGVAFGHTVNHIPSTEVESLYTEARECMKVNAHTASILCSRKLLMNIAVSKGAEEGKTFAEYVNYLSDKGFVPPDGKDWVDHIRKIGNVANHQIKIMKKEDAQELLGFLEMLLRFIFEFPAMIKAKVGSPPP